MRASPGSLVALALVLWLCLPAGAATWTCSTIGQVVNATQNYAAGDQIVLLAGTYSLVGQPYVHLNRGAVIFRGSTGNPDDVIIQGPGMNNNVDPKEGLLVECDDVTIMDLTVKEFFYHGIHIRGENDCDRMWLHNLKTHDIGERHIKGSTNTADANSIAEDCIVEFVQMSQDQPRTGGTDNDYIGGLDVMGVSGWFIHDNIGTNIQGATGNGRPGLFMWNCANNMTVERNWFVGCDGCIAFGNPAAPTHAASGGFHTQGGIIRNNFMTRGARIALELCNTKDGKCYNNTVYSADASYFRVVHIYGANTTNLLSKYQIIRGVVFANGANWTDTGSIIGSTPVSTWFANVATGDLHLTSSATPAIDTGAMLSEIIEDYDKQLRGLSPDKGADEYNPPASPTVGFSTASSSGLESVTSVNLTVTLNFPSNVNVTVNYAATGGTATGGGVDYTLTAGMLTFTPGQTSKTIPITVVNETQVEPDETIIVTLSSPVNATLGTATHTYTILNDDTSGALFTDGFESGNLTAGGWTTTGTVVVSTAQKHTGTYSARLRQVSTLNKALSTVGKSSIHVKFWVRTQGLDSGEYLYCEYSPNGGTNWYSLGSTVSNGTWVPRDYTCPADANNNANFRFRFRLNASGSSEYGYVDDVEVTGQ